MDRLDMAVVISGSSPKEVMIFLGVQGVKGLYASGVFE
jgi:hypothetical protein